MENKTFNDENLEGLLKEYERPVAEVLYQLQPFVYPRIGKTGEWAKRWINPDDPNPYHNRSQMEWVIGYEKGVIVKPDEFFNENPDYVACWSEEDVFIISGTGFGKYIKGNHVDLVMKKSVFKSVIEDAIKNEKSEITFDYTKRIHSGRLDLGYINGYEWHIIEYDNIDYKGDVKVELELKNKVPKLKTTVLGTINIQHIQE